MHDPMVVAFDMKLPIPKRVKWHDAKPGDQRWMLRVSRRTNPENLGERVHRWWRPNGYQLVLAGRAFGLLGLGTVWHVEPNGHDSGEVCKHWRRWQDDAGEWHSKYLNRWKWHVWHWHIQWFLGGHLRRVLFERCIECGRGFPWGYSPISHQWDSPRSRWFRIQRSAYHHECSSLVSQRTSMGQDARIVRRLFDFYRLALDLDEVSAAESIFDTRNAGPEFTDMFNLNRRMKWVLGWRNERGGSTLVPPGHVSHPESWRA